MTIETWSWLFVVVMGVACFAANAFVVTDAWHKRSVRLVSLGFCVFGLASAVVGIGVLLV